MDAREKGEIYPRHLKVKSGYSHTAACMGAVASEAHTFAATSAIIQKEKHNDMFL